MRRNTIGKKKIYALLATTFILSVISIMGASAYMLHYSLYNGHNRQPSLHHDYAYSMTDTAVVMPSGELHHAIYLRADSAKGRTAIIVHGYKDYCESFLDIGRMYHDALGYNILLPDLHGHGLSYGTDIQMGWKDRLDVLHWAQIAEEMFRDSICESRMVIHGVSMGAATTMCLSGEENLPPYIRAFVEDCGYTSVWDEFSGQLKEQFGLPGFPLMHTTSLLCKWKYGWSFGEASPIRQVAKCTRPMLFIHGDADTYVPYSMLRPLYEAKPKPKEMWTAPGSQHAKAFYDYPDDYTNVVRSFLEKYCR
ncbi:MAG: alpha/beta hydrolase [Paraprevotella sp.]|nr:alpha/beta hydrolase [Paraprevotella sp.]